MTKSKFANSNQNISEEEILAALIRSGYLFESEITKQLAKAGFFVESNQSILDPITGKSREIDLVAEYYRPDTEWYKNKVAAKIHFVFEIKNNLYPVVLLTKMEYHPNSGVWDSFKIGMTVPHGMKEDYGFGFYEQLLEKEEDMLFTQYCSFEKKKNDELMAVHPENLYSGLSKIVQFCDDAATRWNSLEDRENETYWRKFLYLPILLIHDDLYECELDSNGNNVLTKVEISKLVINYHYEHQPNIATIYVVTKTGLREFLDGMLAAESRVGTKMLEIMTETKKLS